jgi:hypothetical protein
MKLGMLAVNSLVMLLGLLLGKSLGIPLLGKSL